MWELQECYSIKQQIDKINMEIYELKTAITSPKCQVMTGMPRGGNNGERAIEKYIIKVERKEEKKQDLRYRQKGLWQQALKKMPHATTEEKRLLYLRCIQGFEWKVCVAKMNESNKTADVKAWDLNRAYRVNRKYGKID